jgi:hypothetical protein
LFDIPNPQIIRADALDIRKKILGITPEETKSYPYIHPLNNTIKEEGQLLPEHPALSPFAGVASGSPDAGESPLFFKDFLVSDYSSLH